jgi:hypothetical protein
MKLILFCLFTLSALGQEITDLGVITAHRGIILEKCTNRTDFFQFKIELIAQRWPSNKVEFTTTNEMLTLVDFQAMPPGPCIMGVRSICVDSDESNIALFRVDVRRDPPKKPRARAVQIGTGQVPVRGTTEGLIKSLKENQAAISPPLPPMPEGMPLPEGMRTASVRVAEPLPGGSAKTYSEHMQAMHEFYSKQGRRSQ